VLGMVVQRTDGYFIDFMAPEYLGTSLISDSIDIGDQPIFMDGCALISTISPAISFNCWLAGTEVQFPDLTFIGVTQRTPTGKKFIVNATDLTDGTLFVGGFLYAINRYNGYGLPVIEWASSRVNALAGTPYYPAGLAKITVTDNEPTAKYTKWGTFPKHTLEVVDVIADGILYEALTVDSAGFITLPVAVSKFAMGFRFIATAKTVTPDIKGNLGSNMGSISRVDRAFIRYYKSRTAKIGSKISNMEQVVFPEVPFTGAIDHFIDSSSDREWSLIIKKEQSLPLGVMSVTLRGQTNE